MDPQEALPLLHQTWRRHGLARGLFDFQDSQTLISSGDDSAPAQFIGQSWAEWGMREQATSWMIPWLAKHHLNPLANPDRVREKVGHLRDFLFSWGSQADFILKARTYPGDRVLEEALARWEGPASQAPLQTWTGMEQVLDMDGLVFKELLDSKELFAEGQALRHCVGSYAGKCALGKSRSFSIRKPNGERVSTLELSPPGTRRHPWLSFSRQRHAIVQNKALRNAEPSKHVRQAAERFVLWLDDRLPG